MIVIPPLILCCDNSFLEVQLDKNMKKLKTLNKKKNFEWKTTKMQPIPLLKDLHICAWCENTEQNGGMITLTNTTIQKYEHVEITRSDVSLCRQISIIIIIFKDSYKWQTRIGFQFSKCSVELLPMNSRKGQTTWKTHVKINTVLSLSTTIVSKCLTREKGKYLRL